jgi:hypothetical protein
MLAWFFGAETLAIMTIIFSASGVAQIKLTVMFGCNEENNDTAHRCDLYTELHHNLYTHQQPQNVVALLVNMSFQK